MVAAKNVRESNFELLRIVLMLLVFATKVICMCTYLKNKFRFLGKKIVVLPLGIDNEYFYSDQPSLPQKGLQMVFPAQFRKGKNQDLIIRAFAKHIKAYDDQYLTYIFLEWENLGNICNP